MGAQSVAEFDGAVVIAHGLVANVHTSTFVGTVVGRAFAVVAASRSSWLHFGARAFVVTVVPEPARGRVGVIAGGAQIEVGSAGVLGRAVGQKRAFEWVSTSIPDCAGGRARAVRVTKETVFECTDVVPLGIFRAGHESLGILRCPARFTECDLERAGSCDTRPRSVVHASAVGFVIPVADALRIDRAALTRFEFGY